MQGGCLFFLCYFYWLQKFAVLLILCRKTWLSQKNLDYNDLFVYSDAIAQPLSLKLNDRLVIILL